MDALKYRGTSGTVWLYVIFGFVLVAMCLWLLIAGALKPDDTLINLVLCYQMPETSATYIKKFLRHALRDENIMERQQLGWFLEDQPQKQSVSTTAVAVGE